MKNILLIICFFITLQTHAQFVNNGSSVFIDSGAIVVIDHSLNGLSGAEIVNNGTLYVSGDIVNNATPDFFKKKISSGTLILNGNNQNISGKNNISIYNLELRNDYIKNLQTSLFVSNQLTLNNSILNVDNMDIHIQNADSTAITRTSGYINTQQEARLIRNTSQTNTAYLFPVGSIDTKTYKPVNILTNGNGKNTYAVSFHAYSAANDGYDLQSKDAAVGLVNDQYYYTIQQLGDKQGAGIMFYADSSKESDFAAIGTWNVSEQKWTMASSSISPGSFPGNLNRSFFVTQPDFTNIQYTTIKEDKTRGSKLIQIPNSFTANHDGLNDFWEIKGIEKFPENHVSIYNRWGELIFDTKGYSLINHFDASGMMQGVYMYIVDVRDKTGYIKTYTGDLTILR